MIQVIGPTLLSYSKRWWTWNVLLKPKNRICISAKAHICPFADDIITTFKPRWQAFASISCLYAAFGCYHGASRSHLASEHTVRNLFHCLKTMAVSRYVTVFFLLFACLYMGLWGLIRHSGLHRILWQIYVLKAVITIGFAWPHKITQYPKNFNKYVTTIPDLCVT